MDDFKIEKVYDIKPISDKDSKKEFFRKRKKKPQEEAPVSQKPKESNEEEGHIDIYV